MPRYINVNSALQAHPEFLNEQIDDHDKAIYAKGWNACNSAYYGSIKELPFISPDEVRGVGKWIPLDYSDEAYGNMYKCAKCGCSEIGAPNYCPNCGARMEVGE